jgi:hypothetical protein
MTPRRPLTALALSAIIAGGTLFVVDKRNDEAERTVNDIQQRSLQYQKDMTEAITKGTADAEQMQEASEDLAGDVVETLEADDNVPAEAKAQLEAAKAQLDQAD